MHYAHSLDARDRAEWQLLAEHLQKVSRLASLLAEKFGAARLAALIGLLHDLGKYTLAFQTYIEGRGLSPDHATAGAREIQNLVAAGGPDRVAALVGAYCIAGHHAGLANWNGDQASNDKRLSVPHITKIKSSCHVSEKGCIISMWPPINLPSAGKAIQRQKSNFLRPDLHASEQELSCRNPFAGDNAVA